MKHLLFLLLICFLLSACVSSYYPDKKQIAEDLAVKSGFLQVNFDTPLFQIYAWLKKSKILNDTLVIYIEGDGQAWKTRFQVSKNPTPKKPISLYLAIQDPSENIVYLARPCQFIELKNNINCQQKYWTSHRYSKEIINTYHAVLNQIKKIYNIKEIELVAYSGGGVIASLLAGQRKDITRLTTIASNLDHLAWTQYHKISPLKGSLSLYSEPLDFSTIEQQHFFGGKDSVVPYHINERLFKQQFKNDLFFYTIYNEFNHVCCWVEQWQTIKKQIHSK